MNDEQVSLIPPTQKKVKKSKLLGITLALLLAVGSFFSGMQVNQIMPQEAQTASIFSLFAAQPEITDSADLKQFWRVWNLLDEKFTSASSTMMVSNEDKINGAIAGLVRTYGDPYTIFLPPVANEAFSEDISGNFSGVGMEVGMRDGVITVISPLPDTPAEKAGLIAGDLILKIDDKSTDNMSIDAAVKLIRGEKETEVVLSIYREGDLEIREIPVVRDTITIPTVKTEQIDDTFIIRLYSFNAVAEAKMQDAFREYVKSDASTMILDMRGNPGGYLQSAVSIASYFLPTGKVVVKEHYSESGEDKLYRSQGRTLHGFAPKKIVVLLDKGSASASEILAGALQEHGIATIIGTDSFGKGSVQELVQLPNDASLKVTVARWLTPNGISISHEGLKPDIRIERTPENRIAEEDPQQDAAIRFLNGEKVESEEDESDIPEDTD
jgi:carboxyl-terminal processing protease